MALKVISSRLPIGVATKYNVPDMFKKLIFYKVLVFILTCCTLTGNVNQEKDDGVYQFKSKNLVISSSRLNSNIDIIYFNKKDAFQNSFLEGIKNGYFFLKESQKRNASLNFVDFSKEKSPKCSKLLTKAKKLIYLNSELQKILTNCNLKNSNSILVISALEDKFQLDLNFINPFSSYRDYLFSSDKEVLKEESVVLTDNRSYGKNFFLIKNKSNIEKDISELFEINKSSLRRKELERITQNKIYQSPRFRKDIKQIIIDTNEVKAERIIPAIKFNLIFEPQVYVLPRQLDFWRVSKKEIASNVKGLEHPILLNKNFLFDENFSKKEIEEKLFYSLGFDSLLYFGKGLNNKFNGLLGQYSKEGNKIFIKPEKIDFSSN
tara:strand:- start:3422 stop:4555 length:1134 start_codon:yes stop_codon:yes gene_type:complete